MNTVTENTLTKDNYVVADINLADYGRKEIAIAAKNVIRFKAGSDLSKKVN